MTPARLRATALLAAAFAVVCAAWAAWRQDWTYDEPYHLGWSERLLATGETERASQERFNTKTPASLANAAAHRLAAAAGVAAPDALRFWARVPTLVWLALLLAAVFAAGRRLLDERAACLATVGAALDPNLVAHGSLVTVDVAYALATLLALMAGLRFAELPSARRAGVLGATLGLAFATKFTAVLLLPGLLPLPWVTPAEARGYWRGVRRPLAHAVLAAAVAVAVVDLAYLGRGVARPLADAGLRSAPLFTIADAVPWLRLPLPVSFLQGLDGSIGSERGWGPVVLLGAAHPDGVGYYFVVLWALKTPLLLLLAQLAGLAILAKSGRLRRDPRLVFVAWNAVLAFGYFSFLFKTQIGFRFVLMCVPLAWLLAAPGLRALAPGRVRLLVLCAAVAVAENLAYLGNPLSFTNAAVWPKRQAFRLIADSNIDWGQNRDKIQDWLGQAGIRSSRLDPLHLLPGPNVFSLNTVAGVFDFEQHRWLREHQDPVEQLGHTYLRFDVETDAFDRFMDAERRLAEGSSAGELCGDDLAYMAEAPGTQVPFVRDDAPVPGHVWVACVKNERTLDLGFRVLEGRLRQGVVGRDGRCDAELVQDDQVSWRRLDPGRHALCAIELPNRRPFLPYRVDAIWIVRGQPAQLNLRSLALGPDGVVRSAADEPR